MKNSIRQLFRTKIRTCLFFMLITLCAILICLGSNLVIQCQKNMVKFKEAFTTIGTVEQKPVTYSRKAQYDSGTKEYTYYTDKEYGKVFSISELKNMKDVTYISGPERRASYSAYIPDYRIVDPKAGYTNDIVVEASPLKDGVPSGPIEMKLKSVLFSIYKLNLDTFLFCDHYNDHPQKMYADRTYMMCVRDSWPHNFERDQDVFAPFEYVPLGYPYSEQTDENGNLVESILPNISYEEMNTEFFEKGHYNYWDAYAKELNMLLHKIPVTATDDLKLLMPFFNGDINITDGKSLDENDFKNGNAVCLISAKFAYWNKIKIGDTIELPLRVADYGLPASFNFDKTPLRANGKMFKTFFTGQYTVKGTYRQLPSGGTDMGYSLCENEIIVPRKSIKVSDSDNIGSYGDHVSPYNTSFRIPNGTIDDFMDEWQTKGITDVDIHFYDKGYSQLEAGIIQMERMAVFLLAAGIIMTILVLVFFSSMMIGGQKKRTAIERSLGLSKSRCVCSLLSGILLVAACGCLIGCLSGSFLTKGTASVLSDQQIFDRNYSSGIVYPEAEVEQPMSGDTTITIISYVAIFGFTIVISFFSAKRNLKEEPLALLSGKDGQYS